MSWAPRLCSLLLLGILSVLLLSSTASARPALTTDPRYSQRPQYHDATPLARGTFHDWVKSWWAKTPEPAPAPKHDKGRKCPEGSKAAPQPGQGAGTLDVQHVPARAEPATRPPVALPFEDMLDEDGYVRVDRPADPWQVAHRVWEGRNEVDDGYYSESGSEGSSRQSSRPASPSYDDANEPSRPATPNLDDVGEAPAIEFPRYPGPGSPSVAGGQVPGGRVPGGQAAWVLRNAAANTAATTEGTVAAILGSIGTVFV